MQELLLNPRTMLICQSISGRGPLSGVGVLVAVKSMKTVSSAERLLSHTGDRAGSTLKLNLPVLYKINSPSARGR
jgi:hypothetical protein